MWTFPTMFFPGPANLSTPATRGMTHTPDRVAIVSTNKQNRHVSRGCHRQSGMKVALARCSLSEVAYSYVLFFRELQSVRRPDCLRNLSAQR